jgi:signal peptidase II
VRRLQERGAVAPVAAGRRVPVLIGATTVVVVALDQLAKWWALEVLADGPIHVGWTLYLRLTFNSGASFSLGPGLTPFLKAAAVALLVVLITMTRSVRTAPSAVAMGLLIGGALGNLTDRLVRDHGGAVVDFVDFGWWPVFNVADAALVCGAILLVLVEMRRSDT